LSEGRSAEETFLSIMNRTEQIQLQRGNFSGEELYRLLAKTISSKEVIFPESALLYEDWVNLFSIASFEGVAPLLFWSLEKKNSLSIVPSAVATSLRGEYYQRVAEYSIFHSEMKRLSQKFQELNIPLLFIKGIALAQELYPEPALRPMLDLDLLVHQSDLDRAIHGIESLGYAQQKITYHVIFSGGSGDRVNVELHWNLYTGMKESGKNPEKWIWDHIYNSQYKSFLNHEANLLYLSSHLILQHGEYSSRLIWYYDLYLLLQRYGETLNWDWLVNQAIELGWENALAQALRGTQERFGISYPIERFSPYSSQRNERKEHPKLFTQRWMWSSWRSLSWKRRLQMIWNLIFPQKEYMKWKYPDHKGLWWLLLYPIRWYDLVKNHLFIPRKANG
jgi:hypothetical protein